MYSVKQIDMEKKCLARWIVLSKYCLKFKMVNGVLTHQVVGYEMKLHHPLWLDCVDTLWILVSLAWSFSLRPMQPQLEIKVYDMFVNYVWPNYFWGKRLKVWKMWCPRFLEVVSAYGASPVVPCLISSSERKTGSKPCLNFAQNNLFSSKKRTTSYPPRFLLKPRLNYSACLLKFYGGDQKREALVSDCTVLTRGCIPFWGKGIPFSHHNGIRSQKRFVSKRVA